MLLNDFVEPLYRCKPDEFNLNKKRVKKVQWQKWLHEYLYSPSQPLLDINQFLEFTRALIALKE